MLNIYTVVNYKKHHLSQIESSLCNPNDKFWVLFNALGDCVRYRMVKVLMYHRRMSVTDLARITHISVSAASQQLKSLERSGIVLRTRDGQSVFYDLNTQDPFLARALKLIDTWITSEQYPKE